MIAGVVCAVLFFTVPFGKKIFLSIKMTYLPEILIVEFAPFYNKARPEVSSHWASKTSRPQRSCQAPREP